MKWMVFSLLLFGLWACSNEFDIIEEQKDIPIVYGYLSLNDTAQYIRVEKAFADENVSAVDLAQDPSNLYYENAQVSLRHVESNSSFTLSRVDGNAEGYTRDEGFFAQAPNYLYKINSDEINLIGGDQYELIIDRGDSLGIVTSETTVLRPSELKTPNPVNGPTLDFDYIQLTKVIWQGNQESAVYNLSIDINYRERDGSSGPFETKSVEWRVASDIDIEDDRVLYEIDGLNFYTFLKGALIEDPVKERVFENLTIKITAGGPEINEFVNVASANLGITSTQDVPVFSNIPGGRGIFSSVYQEIVTDVQLSGTSRDSLREGIHTRALNFIN